MTTVTASDFRASQGIWMGRLAAGEKIIVRSREHGDMQLMAKPVKTKRPKSTKPKHDTYQEELKEAGKDPLKALDYLGKLVKNTGKSPEQLIGDYLEEKYCS